MKRLLFSGCFFLFLLVLQGCAGHSRDKGGDKTYIPSSIAIRDTILYWDSVFYKAFAVCDLKKLDTLIFADVEEFFDWGGVMISKEHLLKTYEYRCGKVRELDSEQTEVYPVKNFGAVHSGFQRFAKDSAGIRLGFSAWEKFIHIWRHQGDQWLLTRIIILHPTPPDATIYQ